MIREFLTRRNLAPPHPRGTARVLGDGEIDSFILHCHLRLEIIMFLFYRSGLAHYLALLYFPMTDCLHDAVKTPRSDIPH